MPTLTPPGKIMIIRHAEKPPKHGGEPLDVQQNGEPGNGKSLIVPGWQRAGALNAFFAPYQSAPSNAEIATPNCIYAASPTNESQRPSETVTPLAAWLNYTEGGPQFNISYTIGGGESDLVKSVLGLGGVVLICWEHDNIMPNIMKAIDKKFPISNYASIPNPFPNVFYLVWVLDLNDEGTGYTWTPVNQNLMAGDVSS
ncbi:hypothetical protein [Terriglobus saanensis]|uniref:Phosphoglycerate mutase n=1 Tax=Terriglobus saanensis (strain ATCC BAA-1853 / DSM 23119 / SP1PR4) TaxID=401053 RepID=E8UY56_TERSS|nr:hypothetical protein [Terriglobus saanensis]ADV80866.1 hypothetical protein AciPR4_0024 [Terriglobus saanensis SP1PR4]